MELLNASLILRELPLFSGLSEKERELVRSRSSITEYKKGALVYREGSPADAFYCVVLGRVQVYTYDQSGNRTVLEYLHRGKYFGIISLLTGEPHSVSAEALNDCILLVIQKDDFRQLLERLPSLAIDLGQTLSRRLKNKDVHQKTIFESTVVSVFSSYSQAGKTVYALNLALSLNRETKKSAIIIDVLLKDKQHSLPAKLDIRDYPVFNVSSSQALGLEAAREGIVHTPFGPDLLCIWYEERDEACVRQLVGILSLLVNDYHYIILDLPTLMDRSVYDILNQSDVINILTSPEAVDLKRTRSLIERLEEDFGFPSTKVKVIINEYRASKLDHDEQTELLGHQIFATLPKIELSGSERLVLDDPDSEYARAVKRISRSLAECLVGLALGVGVAYGFCHIGVLRVIEEEHITVDAISGSSIGAIIAALWATGRSSGEILQITKEFREPKYVWGIIDLTLPFVGFIKGSKMYSFLKRHFGNMTFYDVKCPLKIVACDVRRKEPRVIDKGLIVDAVMASCAMPGVFAPFRFKEEMLFDGGVVTPLPTEVLFKMGMKKIIAVNVTPSREDALRQYEKLKEQVGIERMDKRRWFDLKGHLRARLKTNILDIIFSSIEVLQSEVARKEEQFADIVLHPDTSGLHWLELHRSEEFAKRGEEETRRNLGRIIEVINE